MRRTAAAVLVALSTAVAVLPAGAVASPGDPTPATSVPGAPAAPADRVADGSGTDDSGTDLPTTTAEAQEVLETATELADGSAPAPAAPTPDADGEVAPVEPVEASLVMRDLYAALPLLRGDDRAAARAILARPTDGIADPAGYGYDPAAPRRRSCGGEICVHYVTTTADAPPNGDWVRRTRRTMNQIWDFTVGRLNYRRPVSDGRAANNGGDSRFDVYLKDLGANGMYGYCAADPQIRVGGGRAAGYCVLDDDFASWQFGGRPTELLRVTGVHEFFHAVQFAYEYGEDRWMMESTATWIEERYADSINDNRQYLRYGQVARPAQALDTYDLGGFNQYGNWAFWEHLSQRHGRGIVRKAWQHAAPRAGRNPYSMVALRNVLRSRGGFARSFRSYAAANAAPASSYREGRAWPNPGLSGRWRLTRGDRRAGKALRINHLASRNVRVKPARSLSGRRWALKVVVNGPRRATTPLATAVVTKRDGTVSRRAVRLNRRGNGRVRVAFGTGSVRHVTVSLANASTRYRCDTRASSRRVYSCKGTPVDDRERFTLKVRAVRR